MSRLGLPGGAATYSTYLAACTTPIDEQVYSVPCVLRRVPHTPSPRTHVVSHVLGEIGVSIGRAWFGVLHFAALLSTGQLGEVLHVG